MLPYGRQTIEDDDIDAVVRVLRGDWLTTGPTVAELEQQLSLLSGGHDAVTCTSGTAALHIAYAMAGVGPGDQVITTPMTFVATASSASLLGAEVVFADVEEDTALLDPAAVASAVTDRTRVIAAVDYAGHTADYKRLGKIAADAGALTLADAAHSIGGLHHGRPVGDLADITTFSFFPTKNVTTGEGGAAIFKDADLARQAREFRGVGVVRDPSRLRISDEGPWHQEVHAFGLNYRLNDIGCALGLSQLARLSDFKARRAAIVERYNQAFSGVEGIRTPTRREGVDPMWHLYPARILGGRRREVFERMREAGIGVQVNYIPAYWHPAYEDLGYRRGMCPNAEAFYAEELSLPLYPTLADADVDRIIETLIDILDRPRRAEGAPRRATH
ncbi:DegT/DnrJ/EryC1/StrS family aminotransferase [Nocardioides limicola]|uniref:DegT/DnrJ/EryC1/StrS family aminotransferase n=1 Tax=Nocardioides limicola TaxID=2803368 RepID=UPI00193BD98F|nr:aminotransferase class V-fold PLP-dependent enzyme [Nocardioides sp. DJM-14]